MLAKSFQKGSFRDGLAKQVVHCCHRHVGYGSIVNMGAQPPAHGELVDLQL